MAIKRLTWSYPRAIELVSIGKKNVPVLLGVDAKFVKSAAPAGGAGSESSVDAIEANFVGFHVERTKDSQITYYYDFDYDDAQIVQGETLQPFDVLTVYPESFLLSWIKRTIANACSTSSRSAAGQSA